MSSNSFASRRDFLKGSTAAATGLTLAGGLNLARAAHAAGSDRLKVALVGCGGRGTGAAAQCLSAGENLQLVAVADAFEANAKQALKLLNRQISGRGKGKAAGKGNAKDKINVPPDRVFTGLDAYRKAIDCGVDLVLLATPPGFRPAQYDYAVRAGKHVFMEKPVCVDAPGFRSVMQTNKLADEKGLRVAVGLQRRHSPDYIAKVREIQGGSLGKISFLRVYWDGTPVWNRARKPGMTEMQYQVNNWYYFVWLCGDHICEQHVHNLDVANWIQGDHPVEANGMGGCQCRDNRGVGQTFDHHVVEFTYKDGTKLFSQCRQQPGVWTNVSEAVHGDKGKLDIRSNGSEGYTKEHADLQAAIRNGTKLNDGWYGATSSMTAVLGRMATYSGRVVTWDDAVAKGGTDMPEKLAWDANPKIMPDKDGNYPMPVPGIYKPY
jgi:predicted dehydrogenase